MPIDHDAIAARVRLDREAGTPGVWDAAIESGCHAIVAAILPDGANIIALIGNSLETPERETMRFANARRIAALPDLEYAYLDLYDEVVRLRDILNHTVAERERIFALMLARAEKAEAERDALRAALVDHNDLLRSASQIAKREGINGEIASTNWDAYYNRVAVALKRHHAISNEARQALKGTNHD